MTLAQLAEKCNISESSASRYLNGKITPPADVAERLLEVLGEESPRDITEADKEDTDMTSVITQIREIYQAQIAGLQENFASQIYDLRRDKMVLFATIIILVGIMVYLIIDGFHGNWGLFQYPIG